MSTPLPRTGTDVSPRAARPTVGDVMRPPTTTVESHAHLAAAAYLMKHSGDSALVVTTDEEHLRPRAVLTETDISLAVADGRNLEETHIEDLGIGEPLTVEPTVTVEEAGRLMLAHDIRHLPVVEGGRLIGIVDMSDLCRAVLVDADGRPSRR
jgi:CBS domain-containing protein